MRTWLVDGEISGQSDIRAVLKSLLTNFVSLKKNPANRNWRLATMVSTVLSALECAGRQAQMGTGVWSVNTKPKNPMYTHIYNLHIKYIINNVKHKATLVCPNAAVVHLWKGNYKYFVQHRRLRKFSFELWHQHCSEIGIDCHIHALPWMDSWNERSYIGGISERDEISQHWSGEVVVAYASLRFFLVLKNSVQKPMLEETRSPSESHGGQISESILSTVVLQAHVSLTSAVPVSVRWAPAQGLGQNQ